MAEETGKKRSIWGVLLKILGVLLAVYLVWKTLDNADANLVEALKVSVWQYIVAAFVCYGLVNWVASMRWMLLLKVQGIEIPLYTIFKLTLIGVFFSNIIPGSVSGDLIKMGCVFSHAPNKKVEAVLSIFVDRILGLVGLFIVALFACTVLVIQYPALLSGNKVVLYAMLAVVAGALAMACLLLAVILRKWFFKFAVCRDVTQWWAKRLPGKITEVIKTLVDATELYKLYPGVAVKVVALSACVHTMLATQNYLLGKAFHEAVMSPMQYLATTQIGNATGLFPITPGGMGIRDTITSLLFEQFGASPKEALALIPVCYSLIYVLWAIIGAVYMVTYKRPNAKAEEQKTRD